MATPRREKDLGQCRVAAIRLQVPVGPGLDRVAWIYEHCDGHAGLIDEIDQSGVTHVRRAVGAEMEIPGAGDLDLIERSHRGQGAAQAVTCEMDVDACQRIEPTHDGVERRLDALLDGGPGIEKASTDVRLAAIGSELCQRDVA